MWEYGRCGHTMNEFIIITGSHMNEQETKRTIDEVLDVELVKSLRLIFFSKKQKLK